MSNEALLLQFLDWIGDEPRSYRETQDAWRTSCPRLDIWEEALSGGFIERLPSASLHDAKIAVTATGRAFLNSIDNHLSPKNRASSCQQNSAAEF